MLPPEDDDETCEKVCNMPDTPGAEEREGRFQPQVFVDEHWRQEDTEHIVYTRTPTHTLTRHRHHMRTSGTPKLLLVLSDVRCNSGSGAVTAPTPRTVQLPFLASGPFSMHLLLLRAHFMCFPDA